MTGVSERLDAIDITDLLELARKQQAAIDALNDWAGRNKIGFYDEAQDDVSAIIRNALEGGTCRKTIGLGHNGVGTCQLAKRHDGEHRTAITGEGA